jgi:hypothetical protein
MSIPTPGVGAWYRLRGGPPFEIVALDDDDGTIEVQYIDGTLEEIDREDWQPIRPRTGVTRPMWRPTRVIPVSNVTVTAATSGPAPSTASISSTATDSKPAQGSACRCAGRVSR